ncbi:MAG: hypothetical protein C0623_04130 [Desulfuromonas sp.]|nr:MAG: hypothetical protein C0623_04130 [Desulfuromonas sp.]
MKKSFYIFLLSLLMMPMISTAETTRLPSDTFFNYQLPGANWQASTEPPQLAIDAMYVDLVHGKEKKGEVYDPEKLRTMSVEFLKTNNLYIYNEDTEAYLMVSISPYNEKEGIPTKRQIKSSAKWALNAITEHAEVSDLSSYSSSVEDIDVEGMKYAAKIDANYPLFGDPHHFTGIIGYSHPYWVFLYYNDKLKREQDLVEMKRLLNSIEFSTK